MSETTETDDGIIIVDEPGAVAEPAPRKKPKFEGVEDEDALQPKNVQRRFSHYAKRAFGAEAKAREAEARAATAEQRAAILVKDYLANMETSIQRDMDNAKAKQQRAFSEGDGEAMSSASAEMAELAARRSAVQQQQTAHQQPAPKTTAPQITEKTQEFIEENPWFNEDPDAQETAISAHKIALRRGMKVDTPEYFGFVKDQVKKLFPHHFEEEAEEEPLPRRSAPVPPIAAAKRTVPGQSANPRGTLPSLTKEEADFATRMGITPKDYAIQKAKIAGAKA